MISSHQSSAANTSSKKRLPTVLVVEDDPCQRQVVLHMLAGLGVQADCADTAKNAWQRLEQASYDLILLDIELPDADGTTVAGQIRSRLDHQPVVIGFSALADRNLQQTCREAGMQGFYAKPITPATLRVCLDSIR
jgi:two-component system sensor histidine kinase TorS